MGKALTIIKKLQTVEFDWKHDNQHEIGFIAEEVEKVFPNGIFRDAEGRVQGIRIGAMLALIVEAIKELSDN
jgi:hypothetical protein